MWRYTEHEKDKGIHMAVSAFMFLALQISTKTTGIFV
jgi:hypothetical protein